MFCFVVPVLVLASCNGSGDRDRPTELSVYAAAGLTDAITEAAADFGRERGVRVLLNLASSNTLARQILASPRADVFLSAGERWMDAVEEAGLLVGGSRSALLGNSLALVAHPDSQYAVSGPAELPLLGFTYLAVGDPDAVPIGLYAREWLSSVPYDGANVWDAVKGRVSPAPDVRAALAQVEGRADVVGVVYMTDYASARGRVRLLFALPAFEGPRIVFSCARLNSSEVPGLAAEFTAYLKGPTGREIFLRHGFTVLD